MKKVISYALLLVMTVTLFAGCGGTKDDPASAVKATFSALKDFDQSKVSKSLSESSDIIEDDNSAMMSKIFSNMKFEIKDSKIDGETAVVTVDLEMLDFTEFTAFLLQQAFALALLGDDEKAMEKALEESITEALDSGDLATVKRTADINCKKVDGVWKVVPDEQYTNALLGEGFGDLDLEF